MNWKKLISFDSKLFQGICLFMFSLLSITGLYAQNKPTPEEEYEINLQHRKYVMEHLDSFRHARAKKFLSPFEKKRASIVSVVPFSFYTARYEYTILNVNCGLSYEQVFLNGFAAKLVLQTALNSKFTMASMQLKYYLTGQGKCKFAFGPACCLGRGTRTVAQSNAETFELGKRESIALVCNFSLNTLLRNNVFIEYELGIGRSLYHHVEKPPYIMNYSTTSHTQTQIALNVGYRF